jgi:hypothetical protein
MRIALYYWFIRHNWLSVRMHSGRAVKKAHHETSGFQEHRRKSLNEKILTKNLPERSTALRKRTA